MSTDDVAVTSATLNKRPLSHKHRVQSHSPSGRKSRPDQFHLNRTMSTINRPPSKLPNLPPKDPTLFKGYRSAQKDSLTRLPSKIEQQSTEIDSEKRLPILYSLISDNDQKRTSEFRRRQIYALNHFMRNLEQAKFRQFCKTLEINKEKSDNTVNKDEDINKDLLT